MKVKDTGLLLITKCNLQPIFLLLAVSVLKYSIINIGNYGKMWKIMRFPPTNNPIPTSPIDIHVIPVVFAFTFVIEGFGLWYLSKILGLNLKIKLIQSLTLALFLNLVTFFLGNYVLLPFLSPYSGIRIIIDTSALFPIGLIVSVSFFLGFLYGRRRKVA